MKGKSYFLVALMSVSPKLLAQSFQPHAAELNAQINANNAAYASQLAQQQRVAAAQQAEYNERLNELNALQEHLKDLQTPNAGDLFREVNGITSYIYSIGWQNFSGKVIQTLPDGILLKPLFDDKTIFIHDYPFQTVDDQNISGCMAKEDGVYSYTAVSGGLRTVKKMEYGKTVVPSKELLDAEIDAVTVQIANHPLVLKAKADVVARQKAANTKQAAEMRALKANQELAEKGDTYGLLRMGERYRDGQGVEKDLAKARDYLKKAAAAGSATADDELKKMPPN